MQKEQGTGGELGVGGGEGTWWELGACKEGFGGWVELGLGEFEGKGSWGGKGGVGIGDLTEGLEALG